VYNWLWHLVNDPMRSNVWSTLLMGVFVLGPIWWVVGSEIKLRRLRRMRREAEAQQATAEWRLNNPELLGLPSACTGGASYEQHPESRTVWRAVCSCGRWCGPWRDSPTQARGPWLSHTRGGEEPPA